MAAPVLAAVPLSAGAQLAQYRQERGWSVVEVADQLNLAPRQVQALEDENYGALPGMAITRGFIRAYAKLLKVDPAVLLPGSAGVSAATETVTPARRTMPQAHYSDNRLNAARGRQNGSKWYSLLLGLIFLVGAVALAQYSGWLPRDAELALAKLTDGFAALRGNEAKNATTSTGTVQASVPPVATSAETVVATATLAPTTTAATQGNQASAQLATPTVHGDNLPAAPTVAIAPTLSVQMQAPSTARPPIAETSSLALTPATVPAVSASRVAPDPVVAVAQTGNQLVLTFRDDSWVELKGRGKNTVASKLYRAGTTASFDVSAPVQLLVGNAAGVDATLRGAPLALPSAGKNNVARLIVK